MDYMDLTVRYPIKLNTLRPRQNARHFADDMFKCIFLNENVWIPIEISLKFVPKGTINNNPSLFQIMAWRRPGDKPLSEPMMARLLTHICVTRPQWVNRLLTSGLLYWLLVCYFVSNNVWKKLDSTRLMVLDSWGHWKWSRKLNLLMVFVSDQLTWKLGYTFNGLTVVNPCRDECLWGNRKSYLWMLMRK